MSTPRIHRLGLVAGCLLLGATLAGCASAIAGHGQGGAAPSSAAISGSPAPTARSLLPTPTPPASATPSTSTSATPPPSSTTAAPPPADLAAFLEALPAGAKPWTNVWGRTRRPTVAQFVKEFYPASARRQVKSALHGQGVTAIAHQTWVAPDSKQIDIVLMQFRTLAGATSRFGAITAGLAANSADTGFAVPGYPRGQVQGFREHGKDSYGYVRARTYSLLPGSAIVVEAFYFSPKTFDKPTLVRWTTNQLERLR